MTQMNFNSCNSSDRMLSVLSFSCGGQFTAILLSYFFVSHYLSRACCAHNYTKRTHTNSTHSSPQTLGEGTETEREKRICRILIFIRYCKSLQEKKQKIRDEILQCVHDKNTALRPEQVIIEVTDAFLQSSTFVAYVCKIYTRKKCKRKN